MAKKVTASEMDAIEVVKHATISEAISAFSAEVPSFVKDTQAYQYKYVTLDSIIAAIMPVLRKHGLSFIQQNNYDVATNSISVKTTIYLAGTDQSISSQVGSVIYKLDRMNEYQSMGSAITYFRRYDLSTVLGLISETDTDGSAGADKGKQIAADRAKANNTYGQPSAIVAKQAAKPSAKPAATPATPADKPAAQPATTGKPELVESDPKWASIIDYIKQGGKITDLAKRYTISDAIIKVIDDAVKAKK